MIVRYEYEYSKMSDGVFISFRSPRAVKRLTAVIIVMKIRDKMSAFPAFFLTPSSSPAPNFCASGTVNPVVSPMTNPKTRNIIEPHAPTAASASMPT